MSPDQTACARPTAAAPDELAARIVREGVAPTAAVGWAARRGGGWFSGRGGATDALFDLASVSKPATALAVARADPSLRARLLADVVNAARGTPSEDVPIELFLAHRAGLEAHVPLFAACKDGAPLDVQGALRRAASARREEAQGPCPAEGFAPVYSDLGYILAGTALARHEGTVDAGEAVERHVVGPLGLAATLGTARALRRLLGNGAFAARVVPTEVVPFRGGEVRGVVHDENAWALTADGGSGHAGLFGTVDATLRLGCAFLDAFLRGEGPLAGAPVEWLVKERPGGSLRAGFDGKSAAGSSAGSVCGPRTFGHLGFTGTSLWMDPDADAVVVLLTNRVYPTRDNPGIRAARPLAHDALFTMAQSAQGEETTW